jgi:PAS domain-containing protein
MGSTYLGLRSNDLERRVRLLAAGGDAQSEPERRRLSALIQELNSAIASLRIGDDLLRQQNDELDVALARAERERRSHYTLFEFAPIGLLITDSRGVILKVNRAAVLVLACERHELMDRRVTEFLGEDSARKLAELIGLAFTASGPASAYADTHPCRGPVHRIILTLQADPAGVEGEPRIRWAIQNKARPDGAERA